MEIKNVLNAERFDELYQLVQYSRNVAIRFVEDKEIKKVYEGAKTFMLGLGEFREQDLEGKTVEVDLADNIKKLHVTSVRIHGRDPDDIPEEFRGDKTVPLDSVIEYFNENIIHPYEEAKKLIRATDKTDNILNIIMEQVEQGGKESVFGDDKTNA